MAGFQDIIGQEQIKEHMRNALTTGKVSHAYIINGEKSSGKEFIARVFAMALQCEKGGVEPCQECHSCKQALSDNHPDIIRVFHEKPNTISVDDIRTQVNNDVAIKPYSSARKIYIINEAEKMTVQAQNALLKTLEEPPSYVVILLLADSQESFLPTILSRCVQLKLKPLRDSIIRDFLTDNLAVPEIKADVYAAFARGNLGKAVQIASSEDFRNMYQEVLHLLKHIRDMDISELLDYIRKLKEDSVDIQEVLDFMLMWYRDVLLYKVTTDINLLIFKDEYGKFKEISDRSSYDGLKRILEAIDKAKVRLNANVNMELAMELMLLVMKEN